MPRYKTIYEQNAKEYDLLVSREDFSGNILKAIQGVRTLEGLNVAEFGAGTGRVTALLAPHVKSIQAFDSYPAMIAEGNSKLKQLSMTNVTFAQADNKKLPINAATVDLSIAGWTFGHCTSWFPDSWRTEISSAVQEMLRVTKPGGSAIILETLGTGQADPKAPNQNLSDYYSMIENEFGFTRSWIRTDYRFRSEAEAVYLTQTFFGRKYDFQKDAEGRAFLPECTGVWSRINS